MWLRTTNAVMMDESFTINELSAALTFVNLNSLPGPDGVSYSALRHLGSKALQQLRNIYYTSCRMGSVEASCKMSRLVPVLKPGKCPTDIKFYRPIALLNCIGKVLQQFVWNLETRNVYPTKMSRFRQGRSSIDNAIALVTDIRAQKAAKRFTIAVFLDI